MMCRRIFIFVALIVLAQGALAQSPIPVETPGLPGNSSICYRAPVTPVIDGDLSDWVEDPVTEWIGAAFRWIGDPEHVLRASADGSGPDDISLFWATMFDDNYFYFALAIRDDVLTVAPSVEAAPRADSTLCYFDLDADGGGMDHMTIINVYPEGEPNVLSYGNASVTPEDDTARVPYPEREVAFVMDTRLGPAGRFFEAAIPLHYYEPDMVVEIGGTFNLTIGHEESYNTNDPDSGNFISSVGPLDPGAAGNQPPVYFAEPVYKDVIAYGPSPLDGAVDLPPDTTLQWRAGEFAASHDIYFGTDFNDVNDATKASPECKESQPVDGIFGGFDPGLLTIGQTYYWRIDEINDTEPNSPWKGDVWSFTIADFLVVDDFESYDDIDNPVYNTWQDGWQDGWRDVGFRDDNGAIVGYPEPDLGAGEQYLETEIIHSGKQSMPFFYYTDGTKISELSSPLAGSGKDLTRDGVADLSLWFKGFSSSLGSMVESPAGTFTVRGAGEDIWGDVDHFHFVYKEITGTVEIIAKIESLENDPGDPNTHEFAKAGVMIRNTLKGNSVYASVLMSKENGVRNQYRTAIGNDTQRDFDPNVAVPYWVKLERASAGITRFYYSPDGTNWSSTPLKVTTMYSPIYVGMAVSSRLEDVATEAVFSHVTITGTGSDGPWLNQDVGIFSNEAESLYVGVDDAVVYHDDPNATQIEPWTEWRIPLQDFADQGADLTNANKISIGIGTRSDTSRSGSEGQLFIDDMRLYLPQQQE